MLLTGSGVPTEGVFTDLGVREATEVVFCRCQWVSFASVVFLPDRKVLTERDG